MAISWFMRNGNANPNFPQNYTETVGVPSCLGNQQICGIQATVQVLGGQNKPVIDQTLQDEMVLALDTHSNTDNVILKA